MVDTFKQELIKRLSKDEDIKGVKYDDFIDNMKEIKSINCCGEDISSITDVIEQFNSISNSVNNIISKLKSMEDTKVDDFKLLDYSFKILGLRTDIERFEQNLSNI
ncbi:MAG: hypothetical protein K6B70_05115 [Clostridia bacterium]|nr:hypothetical protein [Clostridia bacterium]